MTPTEEEKEAIRQLERLASRWPKSLWLFSASSTLNVMQSLPDGSHGLTSDGGVDPQYIVAVIDGIPNDGGDW